MTTFKKSIGPKIGPQGTPFWVSHKLLRLSPILTCCGLFAKVRKQDFILEDVKGRKDKLIQHLYNAMFGQKNLC